MTSYRDQRTQNGSDIRPFISIVTNFTRPSETTPSLLTFNELTTFLHEFGHALHGMLSKCTYESLSGTSVSRDFVEMPSQFMENFAGEPEVLKIYAKHYKTGEVIPDAMIRKMQAAGKFNQGFATVEAQEGRKGVPEDGRQADRNQAPAGQAVFLRQVDRQETFEHIQQDGRDTGPGPTDLESIGAAGVTVAKHADVSFGKGFAKDQGKRNGT